MPGETLTTVPYEYHWLSDANCYVSAAVFRQAKLSGITPQAFRWRQPRRFAGFLYRTFESSNFLPARHDEGPDKIGAERYQAKLYYREPKARNPQTVLTPKVYWIEFIGREAFCNGRGPDDGNRIDWFDGNRITADQIIKLQRVR